METNFILSTTNKDEKAILYNKYQYRLKRENQNDTHLYIRLLFSYDYLVYGKNHNHDLKLSKNVQTILVRLKY